MNPADEIEMLLQYLTATWGSVCIAHDGKSCAVSDGGERVFEAATLVEALRMAFTEVQR